MSTEIALRLLVIFKSRYYLLYLSFSPLCATTEMSLPDHKDTEAYSEYISFYAARRTYTEPLQQVQDQTQDLQNETCYGETQDHEGKYINQQRANKPSAAIQTELAELREKPFRPRTPRRAQSWSMEDQKHEFHRRLMDFGKGAERGFSET
ncbi:hypothetical protein BDW67DRAFT_169192 [Aspergillus spinulosporus]